jgi:hypothetical protein
MIDPMVGRANEIIERAFALDQEIANARALRALLEDLHARDLPIVKEPHVAAITMVQGGILRAFISSVMACLDPYDRRGNRASVGQILDMLGDARVVARLCPTESGMAALQGAKDMYAALLGSDLFERGKVLRDATIAHLLILSDPIPEVAYEAFYELHDAAERLTISLYEVCGRGKPTFLDFRQKLIAHAKIFWDTYFDGMHASTERRSVQNR